MGLLQDGLSVRRRLILKDRRNQLLQSSALLRTLQLLHLRSTLRQNLLAHRILSPRGLNKGDELILPTLHTRAEEVDQLSDRNATRRDSSADFLERRERRALDVALRALRAAARWRASARTVGRGGWRVADADLGTTFAG